MRRLLVVLVLGVTLAGCETSNLDRSAAVVVSGRVLAADGSPAGGVPVALERQPTAGELITGVLVIPLTLFTACLAQPPAALCRGRSVKRATTTADGGYSFNLTGDDTQTFFGNARTFSLWTEVSGALVTADFRVQTQNLRLPDLQVWQPAVRVGPGRVTWDPPASGSYQVVVEDAGGQLVWTFESSRPEVSFDPRILEDTAGSLAVSARTDAAAEGTTVAIRRQSAGVTYRSAAGPPISRSRACTVGPAGTALSPCPLTDGDLTNRLPQPATTTTVSAGSTIPPAPAADSVTIDLGRTAEVSLIVVRGCSCQVERSTDGQTWTAVGRATGFTAVVPSRTGPARLVRLTGPIGDLREVSVWEGTAAPAPAPGAPSVADPTAPPPPAAIAPTSSEPSRTAPALIALALLVLAAIATAAGALAVRRRPRRPPALRALAPSERLFPLRSCHTCAGASCLCSSHSWPGRPAPARSASPPAWT